MVDDVCVPDVIATIYRLTLLWIHQMVRELDVELARYKSIAEWQPKIGDLVVKYGWITKVKWFGVVNGVSNDGTVNIIKEGTLRLLVTTPPNDSKNKSVTLSLHSMKNNFTEAYSVIQQRGGTTVIYV